MPTYDQEKKKVVQRTVPRAWDSSQLPAERQTSTQQTSQKWYSGEVPTGRETLAQIYKVSGNDTQKRTSLYNKYKAQTQDPTSVLYNPYTQATTAKQNTTNINNTNKALREWDDLSRELSFWATSSRNYSDDEIIANIDWKKYPTLAKMDAGRESGKPLALLTSVGYSNDAMHGVIWGARNPDQKSDNLELDAVKSVLGRGNTYKRDENIAQRLNKASSTYAPYTVGGTMDDLMVKYGTETFDDKWLADNAYMKLDRDMADDYATIYYANQNTKELQQMAEEWKNDVLKDIERGVSLEAIFDEESFEEGYSKLYNLLESQRSGRLVNTTAAIDFDWEGMKKVAAEAYLKKNGTLSTTEYEQQMNDLTGGTHKQSDVDAEIENGWMLNTDILGKQDMTPAESRAFKAKASAGYSDVVFTAADGVANGTGGYAEMQRGLINEANALAGKNLLNVMRGLAEGNRNTLADFVPEQDLKALQEYFPEQYAEGRLPTQEEFNAKRAESSKDPSKEDFWFDFEAQIYSLWNTEAIVSQERDQTAQYQEQLAEIEDAVAEAYGGKDTDQYRAFFASYEYAWDIMNQPDTFDEYDAFQRAAMAEGFDTSKAVDYLLSYAGNAGSDVLKAQAALENAKKMGMDAEAITALEKDLAKKQKNLALVNAHYLTANKDYSSQVKAFDEAYNDGTVTAAAGEHSAEVLAAVVNPEAAQEFAIANRYGKPGQAGMYTALLETAELSMVMTGEERSNYKYLYATKGEEAATAYFDALSENLIVRKSMQDSEARQEWAGENVGNAILATVGSIAVSPVAALEGVVNTLSALFGKDLNPHKDFKVAMAQSDLRTGVKDGVAEAADNEIVSGIFNAVYDAVTSAGDTLAASATGGAWTMALSAMNSSMMDARMRGADTKTALAYGAANAVIELGTEKLGMDRIADAFKKKGAGGVRELLGEMLSGFANEFGEETVGNIAGQLTDDLIMGNLSNYNNAVEQYMSIGLSEEAAQAQAARDAMKEILYGGLVGGLSGGLTSGIGFAAGSVAGKNNPTEAPQKPVEAAAEQTLPVYQGTEKERAVSALSAAQGEGVGEVKQQATVQGVLQGLGVSAQESSAAAKMIMDNAGMKMAQWLIAKSDNPQDVAKALTFAQLVPQSRSAAVLGTKVNSENANAVCRELLEAYKADSADSKNVEQYETAVHESALADAAVEILEKEGSEAIAKANRDKKEREQEKREKTRDFRRKNAAVESAANALKEASAAVAQDASPENIKLQSEANKELQKAKSAREQARVAMEEANAKAKDAAEVEKKVVRNAQNSARMQAQQYVAQETEQRKAVEAEKAVKAEQERAAAQLKQQDDNIKALMADVFVQTYFADAPIDTKQQLRERYIAYDDPTQQVTRENIEFATLMSKKFGFDVQFIDSHGIFEGAYTGGNTIVLDKNATQGEVIKRVLVHEITHAAENSKAYDKLADAVLEAYYGGNADLMQADLDELAAQYSQQAGQSGEDVARSELVAKRLGEMLSGNQEAMDRLVAEKPDVATRIWRAIRDFIKKLRGVNDPELDKIIRLEKMLEKALTTRDISTEGRLAFDKSVAQPGAKANLSIPSDSGEPAAEIIRGGATKFSLTSWNEKEKETVRSNLVKNGYDTNSVDKWISDVNSVAAIIAADKDRLDYKAADNQVMLKNNQEYVKTLDASTLCAKRLLYQGTFNAIQHELPNTVLTSEDLLHLSDMMNRAGLETPCGVCYVESRRRHLGKFAQEWLDSYEGEYKPTLDDVTTTDGLEALRRSHPKVYQDFVDTMNSKGSANPKVVQLRTDYRGDVRDLTKSQIEKIVKIGGLRVQSFSDFETPHLIDMMQAVLDMSSKKLTSQAYTKVPNFAWVFGDTGIKINLSLLAEGNGLNEDGTLRFSSKEGMDIDEAMRLREQYSENVGTILVGVSEEHIRAAMADPRIDYIIPFHKSGWGQNELKMLPVLNSYDNFEAYQNERTIKGYSKNGKPKYGKPKGGNFYPIDYWDYDKSGDENAATYLRMCEADGRVPKFEQFLEKDSEGHWVAPSGYWKMLIDFKMYDNDGNGAPQKAVLPIFNMEEAKRVLKEYEGGADTLPVAYGIADRFVAEKKATNPGVKFSLPKTETEVRDKTYLKAVEEGNEEAQIRLVDAAASAAGYEGLYYHGSDAFGFTEFDLSAMDDDASIFLSKSPEIAGTYSKDPSVLNITEEAPEGGVYQLYAKLGKKLVVEADGAAWNELEPPYEMQQDLLEKSGFRANAFGEEWFEGDDGYGNPESYTTRQIADWAKKHGYDSVEFLDVADRGPYNEAEYGDDKYLGNVVVLFNPSSVKSADLITYDEKGKVIPLSKRFDKAVNDIRFSLPSNDILDQRIAQHRNSQLTIAPNGMIPGGSEQEPQPHGDGERQFVVQTLPNNPNIPEWAVEGLLNNPNARYYEKDTNRDQLVRGWQRVQENGVQSEVERLLSLDTFTADDAAESNLLMAMALREDTADPATFFALAEKSAVAGTDTAQALQVRTMISKMTPDGMRIWAAGQFEQGLREHMRTHQPQKQQVDESASQVADHIRGLQSGDEVLRLNAGGDFTIDESNNRWGIPINEQQQALIDHYKLNKVARPGIFYNRATMKQRMLEAIIATPNPLEVTGLGLNLVQRLEFMQRGEAVITNADLNYMGTQLGQFVALGGEGGGRAADLALARAYEAFGNITPATKMEKFRTMRYVNMLNTFTSFSRNIIGNMGQNAVNAAAHGIGVEIDRLASLGTGRRTMAHLSTAERIEGWKAFAEETKNTFLDFFVDKANTAPNRDKYNTNQRGRTFQSSGFEIAKDIESFLMSVGDRNVWKKAFVNSMAEQQKLLDRGLLFNDDGTTRTQEQMVEQAEADANYATFTEESLAQDVMNYLRSRNPVAADVINLYIPFTGVPHNIMKRNFQYSPFGFLTMAGRMAANAVHGRQFDQHAFVNDLSRALTGTGGVLAGVMLGLGGIIKMGTEDEEKDKVYDVETALGEQYTPYVYDPTTDTYVSMSTFAPSASPLVWGASIGQMLQNDDFNASALIGAMTSSVDSIFDASYLSGLSDLFGGYGSFAENLAHVTAENLSSQLTPAFINQIANAMDPYVRETKDKDYMVELLKTTMNRIPGLRNMLPEKVTVAGENVMTKQGWSLVDPFTRTNPSDNAALLEVKRLYEVTGRTGVLPSDALRGRKNEIKIDKKSVVLNDQQKEEYKKYYGQLWTSAVNELTSDPAYPLMDEDERADRAEDIMNESQKQAKKEFIKRYGD